MLNRANDLFYGNQSIDGYVYVPFAQDELSQEVMDDIERFRDDACSIYKWQNFVIFYHEKCSLAGLPKNAKVYVLGHGIDLSADRKKSVAIMDPGLPYEELKQLPYSDWAYSVSGGKKIISIDEAAKRMIADGLLGSDHINIKLWFCDANNKAYAMTKRFIDNFKDHQNIFKIDYYLNRILSSPYLNERKKHKWAMEVETKNVTRASSIRRSLFSGRPVNDALPIYHAGTSKKSPK